MWQSAGYENKLVWVIVIVVMTVVAATVLWLYQANLVTFGLKQLNAAGCPGMETSVEAHNGNVFGKKCIKPLGGDPNKVDCSGIEENSSYTTADGFTGGCYQGKAFPTLN